jgi:5'-deoxynucleotidase YfbR-like HD superfamily hydrolase
MEIQHHQYLHAPSLPFLHILERLNNTLRAAWIKHGVHSPESVSGHSFRMVILCLMIKVCHETPFSRNSDQFKRSRPKLTN